MQILIIYLHFLSFHYREIAVEILQQEEKGAFIVRESKSHQGCYALSMKVDKDFNESGIANYLVVRTKNGGYTIKVWYMKVF